MTVRKATVILLVLLPAVVWKAVEFGITLRDMLQKKDASGYDVIEDAVGVAVYVSFFVVCAAILRKAVKSKPEAQADRPDDKKE